MEAEDSAIESTQITAWTKPMETIGGKPLFGLISPLLRVPFLV